MRLFVSIALLALFGALLFTPSACSPRNSEGEADPSPETNAPSIAAIEKANDSSNLAELKPAAETQTKETGKQEPDFTPPTYPFALFNGENLEDWELLDFGGSGEVEIKEGELVIGEGNMLSGARLKDPRVIPAGHPYEISIEAKKTYGVDFFCGLTFPVDDLETCATLIVGGWGGGLVGISSLDELDASENSATDFLDFKKKQWYKIRLRVAPQKRIQVWIDDEQVVDANIENVKIGMRVGEIETFMPFGLATYQTEAHYRNFTVAPVDGPAPSE